MSVLMEIYNYLREIKKGDVSFQNLMNKGLKDIKAKDSFLIRDSLKSIVNRYYFLNWELNKLYPIEDEEIKDYIICALGQYHYVKDVKDEDLLSAFNEDIEIFKNQYSPSNIYNAILSLGGSQLAISPKEEEIIIKKLAINYAYPEWVVKMMIKHFGIKPAYKSIASSRKSIKIALNYNHFTTSKDKVLEASYFEEGKLSKSSIRYDGKEKIVDLSEFKKNLIFVEDEATQMLVEKLNLEPGDEALLVACDRNAAIVDMAMNMKDIGSLHVAASNYSDYNTIKNLINRFKLHSVDLFQSGIDTMLTHVPNESCDKVLLICESSSLGLVRRRPAVLLTLNRDHLDQLIDYQTKSLDEASNFVKSGGYIEYAVFTYNRKESKLIIDNFLNNHPEFELIESRQVFSYEGPSDGVYYAILKKN